MDPHHAPDGAPGAPVRPESALVVGAGGVLGSALLAEALVAGRFQRVAAVVTGALTSAVRGFDSLAAEAVFEACGPLGADVAFVVFERQRHSNGRDDAFLQPQAEQLPALAQALHAGGVRRLLVVVPHAPALLPQALKAGFASHDERLVAGLGFEHVVFLRTAQATDPIAEGSRLQRFAAWWLGQWRWMVPPGEQAVRAVKLAPLVVRLARLLAHAPPATRIVPPDVLARAATGDADAILAAWLAPR